MNATPELVLSSDQTPGQTGVDSDCALLANNPIRVRAWFCRDLNIHGRAMGPDDGYTLVIDVDAPVRTACERVGDRKLDRAWFKPATAIGQRLLLPPPFVPVLTSIRLDPGDPPVEIQLPRLLCKGVA